MNTHNCIKCGNEYQDGEVDAYYCEPCRQESKKIAHEVDAKRKNIVRKNNGMSLLQKYDEISKNRNSRFVNFKDLGL